MKIQLNKTRFAVIDKKDFPLIKDKNWCLHKSRGRFYAACWDKNNRRILMHCFILGKTNKGYEIDHINGDGMDNRRINLRVCTHSQNMLNMKITSRNTSGYKGVHFHKKLNKWRARICVNGRKICLGVFSDIKEAAKAYSSFSKTLA